MDDEARRVEQVIIRYATAIDSRDWPAFRSCFTADVDADYGEIGAWTDVDGITAFMEKAHVGFTATNHMITNIVVEVDGTVARARSYVHVVLAADGPGRSVDSVGRYEDELVLDDAWRIRKRRFFHTRTTFS